MNNIDVKNCYIVEDWITHDWSDEGKWYFDDIDDAIDFWERENDDGGDLEIYEIVDGEKKPIEF